MTVTTRFSRNGAAALALLFIAGLAGLAVSLMQAGTSERIAANRSAHATRTIDQVLAGSGYTNQPQEDSLSLSSTDWLGGSALPAYRARNAGSLVATALTIEAAGYAGPIRLLVGIANDGTVLGVRTLEHRETPGLGDKIDRSKSPWITQLENRGLTPQAWRLRRNGGDIDQITGATITSRAVVQAVERATTVYLLNLSAIAAAQPGTAVTLQAPGTP